MKWNVALALSAGLLGCAGAEPAGSPIGGRCASSDDCGEGALCAASGACVEDGACHGHGDCRSGEACVDGICLSRSCADVPDVCGAGDRCSVIGECIPEGRCRADGDCGDGRRCGVERTCLDEGRCMRSADCGAGTVCGESGACVPGSACGGERIAIEVAPSDLLVLLDRSCSMKDRPGGADRRSKWEIAVGAIQRLVARATDETRLGMMLFPANVSRSCSHPELQVPIAEDGAAIIASHLDGALDRAHESYPNGPCTTPLNGAIDFLPEIPAIFEADRRSHVLLVTDGRNTCGGSDDGPAATIEALRADGVTVHVVGFGGGTDEAALARFAQAGGAPLPEPPYFHDAIDADALEASLEHIMGEVAGCTFALASPPEHPEELHVFVDGLEVDEVEYDDATRTLTLLGAACDRVKAGSVADVEVVYGCPPDVR